MAGATGEGKSSVNMIFFDDPSSSTQQIENTHNHFLSFEPNQEIFTNMDQMIGFQTKSFHQQHSSDQNNSVLWKDQSSSKAAINEFYNFTPSNDQSLNMISEDHQFDHGHHPSSCTVFTCEGNERPSQGLSLSLSSSNPSSIGLQSFELRSSNDLQFGPSSSRSFNVQPQQGYNLQFRNSRYLGPAQELLNEFCNLGIKQNDHKLKVQNTSDDENPMKRQSYPLDLVELQRRKTKLLLMLEELERRYKHYCDQMKGVVASFEAVAGNGAAKVYSALASKAMSRHFRCLRDGIVNQIKSTKKAMGEKDSTTSVAPGTTKGETRRLRVLDQTLRQQRALQQMSMMESHPWRPQRGLPERSVSILRAWLFEHFLHPYPSDVDKHILARQTGLSRSQVSNWFINARVRLWKPMVEEMYMEELKDHDHDLGALDGVTEDQNHHELENNQIPSRNEDQKPTHDQLHRIDSECLSSIVNNNNNNNPEKNDSYGATLDFTSYSHDPAAGGASVSYGSRGGGGVSLTLGLHQHGGSGGLSLAFAPGSSQSSLFYPRGGDQMEDCQTVPYSLLDTESQNLPYRSLMGAQLLHDLAGWSVHWYAIGCANVGNWSARVHVLAKMNPRVRINNPTTYQKLLLGDETGDCMEAVIFNSDIDLFSTFSSSWGNVQNLKCTSNLK